MASAKRRSLASGTLAVLAAVAGMLTACGGKEKPASPAVPSSPATSSSAPEATAKAVKPGVDTSFTPSVKPRTGPSALPGNIITGG